MQTNLTSDAGVHSATFRAKLTNYSSFVANVEIGFQITITNSNPCLTTTLTLPTTLTAVTITSLSGVSNSQTFAPATDTAATSTVPGLCGNRIYSIVETLPRNFVSIVAPSAGQDPFVDNWTLTCLSTNLADVGVYTTVTLKVVLESYPSITPA